MTLTYIRQRFTFFGNPVLLQIVDTFFFVVDILVDCHKFKNVIPDLLPKK